MTNSRFDRDARVPRLLAPGADTMRIAPGLYAPGELATSETGLYAFEGVSPAEGGLDD